MARASNAAQWPLSPSAGTPSKPAASGRRRGSARSRTRRVALVVVAGGVLVAALGSPAVTGADLPELLDVYVHMLAGPLPPIPFRGGLGGPGSAWPAIESSWASRGRGGGPTPTTPSMSERPVRHRSSPDPDAPRHTRSSQVLTHLREFPIAQRCALVASRLDAADDQQLTGNRCAGVTWDPENLTSRHQPATNVLAAYS